MIYLVEDDRAIRELMIYALGSAGLEAKGFEDGGSLFSEIEKKLPELIILDIMLPGEDGISILKRLRANTLTSQLPVIMASAQGEEYDKGTGLDLGADDYLAKPFGMMGMVSRVRAVLRRSGRGSRVLKAGLLELDPECHTVFANGKRIELTLKEYQLLKLFMKNTGRVFSRDKLLKEIWDSDFVGETRTVDVHIGTLRTKLGELGGYIETVRGVGYRMEAKL